MKLRLPESKAAPGKTARKRTGTALGYRFVRQGDYWTAFVIVVIAPMPVVTDARLGAIGIDSNADHLALAEVDRSGNMIDFLRLQATVRGQSSDQCKVIYGEAAAGIASRAKKAGEPVVLEARLRCAQGRAGGCLPPPEQDAQCSGVSAGRRHDSGRVRSRRRGGHRD